MEQRQPKLSDAEWIVMEALWEGAPATTRDVLTRIRERTGWAYTTAKTLLERLVEKGAASVGKDGRAATFTPLVSRKAARRSAVRGLVERAFGGAVGDLVHHLIRDEKLSSRDAAQLKRMLDESGKERRAGK
jgi:BlaI family penicillinase repressor